MKEDVAGSARLQTRHDEFRQGTLMSTPLGHSHCLLRHLGPLLLFEHLYTRSSLKFI